MQREKDSRVTIEETSGGWHMGTRCYCSLNETEHDGCIADESGFITRGQYEAAISKIRKEEEMLLEMRRLILGQMPLQYLGQCLSLLFDNK